jgi:hypothetical protein
MTELGCNSAGMLYLLLEQGVSLRLELLADCIVAQNVSRKVFQAKFSSTAELFSLSANYSASFWLRGLPSRASPHIWTFGHAS